MSTTPNPRKDEAAQKAAEVEFRGRKFTVPLDYSEWPLALHEALEDGNDIAAIRAALGADQWRVVRSMDLKTPDINELSSAVVAAMGFGSVGESPASSD